MKKDELVAIVTLIACYIILIGVVVTATAKPVPTPSLPSKPVASKPTPKPTVKAVKRKAKQERTSRSTTRSSSTGYRYPVRVNTPSKRYARTLVSAKQYPCLHELWQRESGWSPTSDNPTSSAYGIPQILGLEARTGDDARAQVRAGLSYIKYRYGTPCRAWSFWRTHRWY